jgi:hypothetical protein
MKNLLPKIDLASRIHLASNDHDHPVSVSTKKSRVAKEYLYRSGVIDDGDSREDFSPVLPLRSHLACAKRIKAFVIR